MEKTHSAEQLPEDDVSTHSDDSAISTCIDPKDKLEELINMELKHSGVYYDLQWKNNLLKADYENLITSCQRFDVKKKHKNQILEERYEKFNELNKRNKNQLHTELSEVLKKIDKTNRLFHEAYEDYSSNTLKYSSGLFNNEREQQEKMSSELTKNLNHFLEKEKITKSLMMSKQNSKSTLDNAVNMVFELSLKRPEIQLDETLSKLEHEMGKLEKILKEKQTINSN